MSSEFKTDNIVTDNIDLSTINGSIYPPVNQLLPLPLVASKVLATNTAGTAVLWGDVPHGTARQLLQTNAAGNSSEWTSSIDLPGTLDCTGAATFDSTLVCSGTANLAGNLQFAGVSGTSGQYLKKTGAATQSFSDITATDIKGGTLNQVLQSDGTTAVFNTNVTLPGNLTMNAASAIFQMSGVNSVALVNELRIFGALKFSNVAGTTGTVPVSDASGIPTWQYQQYYAEYYQNTVVDMNSSANVTLLAAATPNVINSNIVYSAGVFTVPAGSYTIVFQTISTPTAGGTTRVNFRINGIMNGSVVSLPSTAYNLILQRTYRFNTNSNTIEVISQPVLAGTVNTSPADPAGIATTLITIQRIGSFVP